MLKTVKVTKSAPVNKVVEHKVTHTKTVSKAFNDLRKFKTFTGTAFLTFGSNFTGSHYITGV